MKVITIGRDSASNEIAISDPKASRTHLQLVMDDNGNIFAVDLDSTNGTFINGQRITGQAPLHPGDDLRIGDTSLPWLNYLQTSPVRTPSATPASGPQNSSNGQGGGKKKALIWIIVASAVVLIALGIGLVMLFNNGGNTPEDSESEYTPEPGRTIVDVDVEQGIEVKPDPKETKKKTPDPKLLQLDQQFEKLFNELKKAENKQWKDSVIKALNLNINDVNILKEKFNNSPEKEKQRIIEKINGAKPKSNSSNVDVKPIGTEPDLLQQKFQALCDDLEKSDNKDWKLNVLEVLKEKKIINKKNMGTLKESFSTSDPKTKLLIISTIEDLKPNTTSSKSTQQEIDNKKENAQNSKSTKK
jgi:flagellar basal body-associated protein FliL